jgi:hypothetical protein
MMASKCVCVQVVDNLISHIYLYIQLAEGWSQQVCTWYVSYEAPLLILLYIQLHFPDFL